MRADEQGYVEIVGRLDDRISCAGESIYPKEVENVLMGHPDIVDAAVVAMADEIKGEVPVAFVVERVAGCAGAGGEGFFPPQRRALHASAACVRGGGNAADLGEEGRPLLPSSSECRNWWRRPHGTDQWLHSRDGLVWLPQRRPT